MSDHPDRPRSLRPQANPPEMRTASIRTPDDVIRAVPYLLGFHPRESLVLLALAGSRLVLTVRLDLADAAGDDPRPLRETLEVVARAQATRLLGVVVTDTPPSEIPPVETNTAGGAPAAGTTGVGPLLPYTELVEHLGTLAAGFALELADTMLLHADHWWSYRCDDPACCPPAGRPIDTATTSFEALAVTYGTVPLADRDELERLLHPSETQVSPEQIQRAARALHRRMSAAARTADPNSWQQPLIEDLLTRTTGNAVTMASAAWWGVALRATPIRDAAWVATDSRQIPDPQWWRMIGRLLPAPYCAAPLFLFGWASWRAGNGALANVCVDRILAADPDYSAARLLDAAVRSGKDPATMPPLNLTR